MMNEYQKTVKKLSENTQRIVLQVWANLQREDLPDLLATLVARANAQGHYLTEQALANWLAERTGSTPAAEALGLDVAPAALDLDRLASAIAVTLEDPERAEDRLGRLARSEPIQTAQRAMALGIKSLAVVAGGSLIIDGWRRDLNPGACELCQSLAEGGRVFPAEAMMSTHTGCQCTQMPVQKVKTGVRL